MLTYFHLLLTTIWFFLKSNCYVMAPWLKVVCLPSFFSSRSVTFVIWSSGLSPRINCTRDYWTRIVSWWICVKCWRRWLTSVVRLVPEHKLHYSLPDWTTRLYSRALWWGISLSPGTNFLRPRASPVPVVGVGCDYSSVHSRCVVWF